MKFEQFKPLIDTIRNEGFTRQQLMELLGAATERVCRIDEPELEGPKQDLSEAYEAVDNALDEVEARQARNERPEPTREAA